MEHPVAAINAQAIHHLLRTLMPSLATRFRTGVMPVLTELSAHSEDDDELEPVSGGSTGGGMLAWKPTNMLSTAPAP
jgi:hypothetical protein